MHTLHCFITRFVFYVTVVVVVVGNTALATVFILSTELITTPLLSPSLPPLVCRCAHTSFYRWSFPNSHLARTWRCRQPVPSRSSKYSLKTKKKRSLHNRSFQFQLSVAIEKHLISQPDALQLTAPLQSMSQVLESKQTEIVDTIQHLGHEMYSRVCRLPPSHLQYVI